MRWCSFRAPFALSQCPSVKHVVVYARTDAETGMKPGRDVWWHEEMAKASPECAPEWMDAEDPLYLLYTLIHVAPMTIGFANWVTMKLWGRRLYRDHYQPGDDTLPEASSETALVLERLSRAPLIVSEHYTGFERGLIKLPICDIMPAMPRAFRFCWLRLPEKFFPCVRGPSSCYPDPPPDMPPTPELLASPGDPDPKATPHSQLSSARQRPHHN